VKLAKLAFFIQKHRILFLLVALLLFYLYPIWDKNILFSDELIIEDIAYTMAHNHNYIIPLLNGVPHLVKPPLLYWLISPLYVFFSPVPWVVRLWMPILAVLLLLTTYKLAKLWYGEIIAFWSLLFLGLSTPLIFFTKAANFDLLNSLLVTSTIYFYNRAKKDNKYLILASISLGLGILNRSFLALAPLPIIAIDNLLSQQKIPKAWLIISFVFALCIALPWHLLAYREAPYKLIYDYFFVPRIHVFEIFPGDEPTSPVSSLITLFWWFPPTFFLFLYPFWHTLKRNPSAARQLIIWLSLLLLLILSRSPEVWYFLMFYPAIAICAGCILTHAFKKVRPQSIAHQLLIYLVLVVLIEPPLNLVFIGREQIANITAANLMTSISKSNETLYLWHYNMVPVTRFFPKRPVYVLSEKTLKQALSKRRIKFLLIRKSDFQKISEIPKHTILFQKDPYLLLRF